MSLLSRIATRFTQNSPPTLVTKPFTAFPFSTLSILSPSSFHHWNHNKHTNSIHKQQRPQTQPQTQEPSCSLFHPTTTLTSTRSYWREVLRYTPNPKNPSQVQCEDPNLMALRSSRAQSAEGLLRRRSKYLRYEKPWMKRKKLKMVTKYKSMEKGVNDLKLYVKYIQEAKDIYDKSNSWK